MLGGTGYAGASYYQVNKLVKEGDKLRESGDYTAAKGKYESAKQKQKWPNKIKINDKVAEVDGLIKDDENFKAGDAAIGKGEWQKCLDYLNLVTDKYPKHGESQNRYTDCQKKIDEEAAAQKAAEEAAAKAKAEADAAAAKAAEEAVKAVAAKKSATTPAATSNWKISGKAVSGQVADADIVALDSGQYRLYYAEEPENADFHGQVYSAISSDGMNWTVEAGERKSSMTFPDVIKLPDGRFRMYFQNHDHVIASAISTDGLTFTDEPGLRVDNTESGYSIDEIGGQSTMIMPDGTYMMVYSGTKYNNKWRDDVPNDKTSNFFYATSSDGINWQKRGLAINSDNNTLQGWVDGADLVNFDGEIRVYFWSYFGVYYAKYSNGSFANPVFTFNTSIKTPDRVYPENIATDPTLLKINGQWFMYYGGAEDGIQYAVLK